MTLYWMYFLPAILVFGIITSYEDLKEGKIRNKWVLLALIFSLSVNIGLIIHHYLKGSLNYSYVVEFFTNMVIAIGVGFGAWLANLWTAGDGKLFISYAALVPISLYSIGHIQFFPAATILINTFISAFIFLFFVLIFKTSLKQKKESLLYLLKPKNLAKSFINLFAIFWIVRLFFSFTGLESNYLLRMSATIIIYFFIERLFKKNALIVTSLIFILRLLVDRSIYSFAFVKSILFLLLFWIIFRGFIINLEKGLFYAAVKLPNLRPGMVPLERIYKKGDSYLKAEKAIHPHKKFLLGQVPEGLTKKDINMLKKLNKEKKLKFNALRVHHTIAFAPFMLLGVLLTIIAKGNFLIFLKRFELNIIDILRSYVLPLFILCIFFLIVYLAIINKNIIKKEFLKIKKSSWVYLLLVFLLGFIIRMFILQHQHLLYIDEQWYMESAKNLLKYNEPILCSYEGKNEICGLYPKELGWPVLLSYVFLIFGVNNYVALNFSAFIGSISIILLFMLTYLLSKRADISLISSILFALSPLHIRWSGAADTNIPAIFFSLLTLILFQIFIKSNKTELMYLSFLSLAFTAAIRVEYIILLIPLSIILILNKKQIRIGPKHFLISGLTICLVFIPQVIQSYINNKDIFGGAFFTFGNITKNIPQILNIFNFKLNYIFLFVIIIGLLVMYNKNKKSLILLSTLILSFLVMYALFRRMQIRFLLLPLTFLMIFAGYGFYPLLKSRINGSIKILAVFLVILYLIPQIVGSLRPNESRLLETKIPELIEKGSQDCYLIVDSPTIFTSTTELKVISTSSALRNVSLVRSLVDEGECVLFLEDFYCFEDIPYGVGGIERCKNISTKFNLTRDKTFKGRGINYSTYKIS